jgi:hypothetical protein
MKPLPHVRNDIFAGLVSAAVAIPLAMGFGMFAFAALGEDYFADGALAGIATAFVVAIVCVLLGDKTTTVYAPRITTTFFLGLLIYGLVHSDEPMIAGGGVPLILAIAFAIVLLAGALQALFGLIKLGTLIKFMPQPVMAGFQNAAAALLFLFQLGNVCGFDRSVAFTQVPQHLASIKPLSLAIAAVTFATMWNAKKLLPKIPPIIVGISLGCMLYYLCRLAGLGSYLGPIIASGPRTAIGLTTFPYFSGLARGGDLAALVPTILGGALALAIIAAIDALLCAKLVTAPGEPRRDGNWLLVRLGTGNLVAACIGGITSGIASIEDADILPDVDRAIERAEDDLLRAEPRLRHTEVPLTTVGLFAGFGQSELDAIEPLLRRAHYEKGSVIFREGDPGDELLIVTNGTASAYLQLPQMNVRLASFAPGTMFGELALLDQGPRSATVIADEELVCYALSKANFAVLAAKVPDVAIRLVAAIGRELSGRLRGANRTIHQLET